MGYVVDFQLKGLQNAARQINAVTQAAKQLQAVSGGSGGGSGGGSRASGNSSQANAMKQQAQMVRAQAQLINAQTAYGKAVQRANQSQQSPGAKALKNLIYSTRVGVGANGVSVMPLVGNLVKMMAQLGPEGEVAAVGLGLLVSQIVLMAAAVQKAAAYGKEFASAYFAGGGSMSQTSGLVGIGAAAGIGPEQIAGMAQSFNQSIQSSPYALAQAQKNGFGPNYNGSFGNINDTERFLNGLKYILRSDISDDVARRTAKGNELQQFLWMRKASSGVVEGAMNAATAMQTPKLVQKQVDAQILLNTAMSQSQMLLVMLGNDVLPTANKFLAYVVDNFQTIAYWAKLAEATLLPIMNWLETLANLLPNSGGDNIKKKAQLDAEQTKATRDLTKSMDNVARVLTNDRQVFNGGPNAGNAVNKQYWRGTAANRAAIHMGQIPT